MGIVKGDKMGRWHIALRSLAVMASLTALSASASAQFNQDRKPPGTFSPDSTSRESCERTPQRVFVASIYGTECISYYISAGAPAEFASAVIHFHGDFTKDVMSAPEKTATLGKSFQIRADRSAKRFGVPYIYVMRPGLLGSTGDHLKRRQPKEFHSMNAAVDMIKERYKIGRLALAGQSGGGSVVASLLSLGRRDVACAAPASGALDIGGLYRLRAAAMGRTVTDAQVTAYRARFYSPIEHVAEIPKDPTRRLFVIGDPRDKNTFFSQQRDYAYRVKAAGHHSVLLLAPGAGDNKHGLGPVADDIAGLCLQGKSDEDIEKAVGEFWKREYYKRPPAEIRTEFKTIKPEAPAAAQLPVP